MFHYNEMELQIQNLLCSFLEKEVKPNIEKWEKDGKIPRSLFLKMAELGLLGNFLPEEMGGSDFDTRVNVIIAEEIGKVHRALGFLFIHNMVIKIIYQHGTKEQIEKYIPPLVRGDMLACFCLTEPDCGSDAGAITSRAVKSGNDYILNGTKCFITNADVADLFLIAAKTDYEAKNKGVSIFLAQKEYQGLSVPRAEEKMGIKATSVCEVHMDDLVVHGYNLLGGVENKGFSMLMDGLETGRITNGALSVGIAQGAYEIALNYAQERKAFGQVIADFQAISFMLAVMSTEIEAARLIVHKASWAKDNKLPTSAKYASMAKRLAADTAMKVTTDAVQILGGWGYMHDYQVERYMRDAKGAQIVEGTSQIQNVIIAKEILQGR